MTTPFHGHWSLLDPAADQFGRTKLLVHLHILPEDDSIYTHILAPVRSDSPLSILDIGPAENRWMPIIGPPPRGVPMQHPVYTSLGRSTNNRIWRRFGFPPIVQKRRELTASIRSRYGRKYNVVHLRMTLLDAGSEQAQTAVLRNHKKPLYREAGCKSRCLIPWRDQRE